MSHRRDLADIFALFKVADPGLFGSYVSCARSTPHSNNWPPSPGIGTRYEPDDPLFEGRSTSFPSLDSRNTSFSTGRSTAGSKSFASCTVHGTFKGCWPKASTTPDDEDDQPDEAPESP